MVQLVNNSCSLINLKYFGFKLVFPRDGTSRRMSRDKPGRDVPLSLCPGTKKKSCPGVPLSRDKGRSKRPGTNSSVPARPGTKRFKNFQKKRTRFPILEHHFSVLEYPFLF